MILVTRSIDISFSNNFHGSRDRDRFNDRDRGGDRPHRINFQIRVPKVQLILDDRNMGVVPKYDAQVKAQEMGLDLVEIDCKKQPPLCKIMDYGKFCYEQEKAKKRQRQQQQKMEMKEVRLTAGTDANDVATKVRQIRQFLQEGKQVRVTVFYKKRQIVHAESGHKIIDSIIKQIEDIGKVDSRPRLENRNLSVQIAPKV